MVYEWPTFTNTCLQLYLASSNQVILDSKNHALLQSIKSKELCIQYCGLFLFITHMLMMSRVQLWALIKSLQVLTHMGYCQALLLERGRGKGGELFCFNKKHIEQFTLSIISLLRPPPLPQPTPIIFNLHIHTPICGIYCSICWESNNMIVTSYGGAKSCCPSHPLCLHGSRRRISLRKVDLFCP
jgi:hypothetical protein